METSSEDFEEAESSDLVEPMEIEMEKVKKPKLRRSKRIAALKKKSQPLRCSARIAALRKKGNMWSFFHLFLFFYFYFIEQWVGEMVWDETDEWNLNKVRNCADWLSWLSYFLFEKKLNGGTNYAVGIGCWLRCWGWWGKFWMGWWESDCLELLRVYWVACKCDCLETLGYVLGWMIAFCS